MKLKSPRILQNWFVVSFCFFLQITSAQAEPQRSVYEVNPLVDGAIIGVTGLSASLVYLYGDRWIHQKCPCGPNDINAFDRGAVGNSNTTLDTISDITVGLAVLAPPILDAIDLGMTKEFEEDLFVYAETFSMNSFLVTFAKYTVQRPLPRTVAGDPTLVHSAGGYRSFYSGHTSTFFSTLSTAAITLNLRYHQGIWPWLIVIGLGASVGVERVAAGRHFPSDVIVGALAGTAVGVFVPFFHQKPDSRVLFTAAPIEDGAMLFGKLNF